MPAKKLLGLVPNRWGGMLCANFSENKKCSAFESGRCTFAHSKEELEVWAWMAKRGSTFFPAFLIFIEYIASV